jgi:hypothetical protein
VALALLSACSSVAPGAVSVAKPPAQAAVPPASAAAKLAFRNAVEQPPAGWDGPVFTLSRDYPSAYPGACPEDVCTWLGLDVNFSADLTAEPPTWNDPIWGQYMQSVLDYVKEGQDPQLSHETGFLTEVGGETRWYHVPWMAYDPTAGREFVHGTTNERTAHLSDLLGAPEDFGVHELPDMTAECQAQYPHGFETWAVGMYNQWGGWSLGQVWGSSGEPHTGEYMGATMPAGLPFPEGTVVAKLLFTTAPVECAPYLADSPEWQVHRHAVDPDSKQYLCERDVQTVRLVQVDIAVVDVGTDQNPRSPTRWVYGTFAYNGFIEAESAWDRLAPVGIQWGSDPWTFPAVPEADSIPARQSVLNQDIGIFEHNGCRARLAGPVDNPQSSCMSCHASAFAAPNGAPSVMGINAPDSFGFTGICENYSQDNANYFQNMVSPQGYHGGEFPDALNLDTSLQMWVAFTQYGLFKTNGEPEQCNSPDQF